MKRKLRRPSRGILHLVSVTEQQSPIIGMAAGSGFQVETFQGIPSYHAALEASHPPPDLLLVDGDDPFGVESKIADELVRDAADQGVGVIVTSTKGDLDRRIRAHDAGVDAFMEKPISRERLLHAIEELVEQTSRSTFRVIFLAENASAIEPSLTALDAMPIVSRLVTDLDRALDEIDDLSPDVIAITEHFHGISAGELAAVIRENDKWTHVPILVITESPHRLVERPNAPLLPTLTIHELPDEIVATARLGQRHQARETVRHRLAYEREREHQALNEHAIVSVADHKGAITYVNDLFCQISGYQRDELIGENHRLLKSGVHPPPFYEEMWRTIARGQTWRGDLCNRRKDGSLYWVRSTITPMVDETGKPYQYISLRTDITHVKAIENSLREFRNTLDQTLDCVFIFDAETLRFTYANQGAIEQVGYSLDELLDMHPFDIEPDHDPQSLQAQLKPLKGNNEHRLEFRTEHQHKDGSRIPVEISIQYIESPNERPRFIAIVRDITERLTNELKLERSRERLRRGQISANIGTWDWNIQTGDLYWSERIGPLFGYPEGVLDTSFPNFVGALHPEDKDRVLEAINRAVNNGEPYEVEHRVVWPDGSTRWLLEKGAVENDEDNQPLRMLGVVQDIHDRKKAEGALAESRKQLIEAQALAQVGSWKANLITGELSWSDEIFRIFGHEPQGILPSVEHFMEAVHPEDRDFVRQSEIRAEETGRHDVRHRIVRPDGTVRHVHELAEPEYDSNGRLVALTGTVQDITEGIKAEEALIKAREEAEAASRTKSDFLSSMSHELRTPLNAILGFGQLLEHDEQLSTDQKDSVGEIIQAGHHLLDLINDVLDLSKIESGKVDLSIEPLEVCDVIEECLKLVTLQANKRNISICHSGMEGVVVSADRVRLKQALLNLLSNAVKYNVQDGSIRLTAQIEPNDSGRLRIVVEDTGPGISLDQQRYLFEPFNRLGAERSGVEGTGIGLAITKETIELMGGTIGFESSPGKGSRFWITLPIESLPANTSGLASENSDSEITNSPENDAIRTVLYIEDNPANLKLVANLLSRRPHIKMLSAHTPELGLQWATQHKPDLILLDINMPRLDGYQVLSRLQSDENLAHIPVVAVTANAMPKDIQRGIEAGFTDYLTKPLDIARFQSIIDENLLPENA